jgi:hypothetical protein
VFAVRVSIGCGEYVQIARADSDSGWTATDHGLYDFPILRIGRRCSAEGDLA